MKRIFKRVIVPLLALVMLFSSVPVSPVAPVSVEAAVVGTPTGLKNEGFSSTSMKTAYVSFKSVANANGYEYVCTSGGKTVSKGSSGSSVVYVTNLGPSKMYRLRVRAYRWINGTKKYGSYSKVFVIVPDGKLNKNTKAVGTTSTPKLRLAWNKISGAKNYYVYVSTSRNSGYKRVKKLGSGTRTYTLSRFNGKKLQYGKTYYIKVRTRASYGGKNFYSPGSLIFNTYLYKVYK